MPERKIQLTRGKFAIVDEADFQRVSTHKWHLKEDRRQFYAKRYVGGGRKKPEYILMHHEIIGKPKNGHVVDHKNGNGLDNRRRNLKFVKRRENVLGAQIRSDNTSGIKGVCWDKQLGKWRAKIQVNRKHIFIGLFDDKKKAGVAYQNAAKKHFGVHAKIC